MYWAALSMAVPQLFEILSSVNKQEYYPVICTAPDKTSLNYCIHCKRENISPGTTDRQSLPRAVDIDKKRRSIRGEAGPGQFPLQAQPTQRIERAVRRYPTQVVVDDMGILILADD